jgi:hypothetical protein
MKGNQLNRGASKRLMYVEPKSGALDGADARIGWVTFSKTGKSIYYRGRSLLRANGVAGNYIETTSGEEFWVSGVKQRGSNVHPAGRGVKVVVDDDALNEYQVVHGGAA